MRGAKVPPMPYGFHGTIQPLVGDSIEPANMGHAATHPGTLHAPLTSTEDTYFVPSRVKNNPTQEQAAWDWAGLTQKTMGGRPTVHTTMPESDQFIDANVHGPGIPDSQGLTTFARQTPRQKVVDTHWGPPAPERGWTAQTIPHINWNQFGGSNYTTHADSPSTGERWSGDDRGNYTVSRLSNPSTGSAERPAPRPPELQGQLSLDTQDKEADTGDGKI